MTLLAGYTSKTIEDEMLSQSKGVIREVLSITPPAQRGEGVKLMGVAARRAGEARIDADLRGVFQGVKIRGFRMVPHLFGDRSPEVGKKPPYRVATKEKHLNVEGIYNARQASRSRRGKKSLTRGQRAPYYVDEKKLDALARKLKGNVGKLAQGFKPAADRLGLAMPVYARGQHNAPGSIDIDFKPNHLRIVFTNNVSYSALVPDMPRRMQWAVDQQARKIERQLPYLIRKAARDSGFKVRS